MSGKPSVMDALAQERDAKFKVWLQNKAIKDKAFEFLGKLNSERASEEESLIEVAIALCAVDRLLGKNEVKEPADNTDGKDQGASAKKTLKSAWFRWCMEFHGFSMLQLSDSDVAGLSGAVREFLMSESDIVAGGGNYGEELDRASRTRNILPSLKYFFPQVPKPNEKPRALTNDQKMQNQIYMREARKLWRKAGEELNNRVVEYVAKAMNGGSKKGGFDHAESECKGKAEYDNRGSDPYEAAEDHMARAKRLESQCLNELSLKQLKMWLDEDAEKVTTKANEDAMEKLRLAKQSHEQFVRKKDGLRIRMPDTIDPMKVPNMGYGREMSGVRPAVKGVSTTVDLMAGMGMKYVHATNKGRKGQMGDLEKSREQLLKLGFVDRANFDGDARSAYERERDGNSVIQERAAMEAKLREENAKAYDEWIVQKEMRDSALKCLALVPKPVAEVPVSHDDVRGSANLRKSASEKANVSYLATMNPMQNPTLSRHCLDIGKAMKRVDRTTFLDWAKWCEGVFSINTAQVLWDFFPPVSCDVHCASYSQVRDTFLKLLRPGVDYRETFLEYVEKNVFAKRISRFKDDKNYYHKEEDEQRELDEELESLRKEWLSHTSLSKADMAKLLRQMGIALKETEMRSLVDAFDTNGDGVITISEFLDFTGPKRDKRSGNNAVMSQRCCWLTTCRVTGMPGAYSVSAPTKRSLKAEESKSSAEDRYGGPSEEQSAKLNASTLGNVNIVVRKLATGESRMCIELRERRKREDLLRKMGLIDSDGKPAKNSNGASKRTHARNEKNAKRRDAGEDEYEDDFGENDADEEYGDDFDDHDEKHSPQDKNKGKLNASASGSGGAGANSCDFSTWRSEDRKKGLKFMLDLTKDARQEETLKTLLANGVPPAPPKLWVANEHFIETRSLNRSSKASLGRSSRVGGGEGKHGDEDDEDPDHADIGPESTEITLFWGPHKGDLVSFYSIEYGGVVGAQKTSDVKYNEIFRDPEDANPNNEFLFSYTMRNLTPGASYRFRIRAFNGFGAGEYTYKTFTTVTAAPTKPRVIKTCSDSVALKWTFSAGFFRRLEELKKIFLLADSDHSGCVSREELTALLDERASASADLKVFLNKVATSLGLVISQGYDALFDMIEGDDDGGLSWTEFEAFFMAAGWGNAPTTGGTGNYSSGIVQSTLKTGAGPAAAGINITPGDITYVVERCESEVDDKYKEVLRTTLGYGTLTRLEPGKSYRFRIHSLNADGVAGPHSPSVLVHTLVETPAAPSAPAKYVQARRVTLMWKARNCFTGTRNKAFTDKMLGEWAGALGDDEGGVSIRAAFDKYDRDQSGDIDSAELRNVLEDLGVDASDERLNEAFELLDANGDGIISYEEFGKWWRRDQVSYTLKRSEEVIPLNSALYTALDNGTNRFRLSTASTNLLTGAVPGMPRAASRGRGGGSAGLSGIPEETSVRSVSRGASRPQSAGGNANTASATGNQAQTALLPAGSRRQVAVPIVSYRGDKTRCEVMGLTPNRLYHFKLRYVGSRSNSVLSPPLVLMTAPLPTSAPILVDLTSNTVRVKWYPAQYGAFKFIVHMRLADGNVPNNTSNLNLTNNSTRKVGASLTGVDTGEDGWIAVYNGQDNVYTATSLASGTSYQLRVLAVNCQGASSEPSEVISFATLQRSEKENLTPKNAAAKFTIECTADICVGDVILITERLFVKNRPTSAAAAAAPISAGNLSARASLSSGAGMGLGKSAGKPPIRKDTTAPVAQAKTGMLTNMSVTSLNGTGLDAASITPSRGEYLGERTIAAYVSRDNYRTIRDAMAASGTEPRNHKKFGAHRKLWLEVVWQRTADEACKPYDLKSGEVLERMQSHLEQFEVFRCGWKEENKRKPLQEEWKVMMDCFVQTDC